MRFLAVAQLKYKGMAENIFDTEKEAHEWLFGLELDVVSQKVIPIDNSYAKMLLNEAMLMKPEIQDNRN